MVSGFSCLGWKTFQQLRPSSNQTPRAQKKNNSRPHAVQHIYSGFEIQLCHAFMQPQNSFVSNALNYQKIT